MALQLSTAVRNARLDAIESTIGTSPILKIRSGTKPADCATAATGTVLATINLPSDWAAAASGAQKTLLGTWQDASADATGTAGWFELLDNGGTTRHIQGAVTASGGGGEMTVDSTTFTAGQQFTVLTFTITDPNG